MTDFVQRLAIETWTLWTFGILLVACRMISRRIKFRSWSKLQIEDWLMMAITVTFTVDMFCVNEVAKNGSNYLDYETAISLSKEEADKAIYGSKMALTMELFTLTTIWLVKGCLLILYHRLTMAYQLQHLIVKILAVYCVVAYILVVSLLLGHWCKPVQQYWALPVENSECATFYKHMIFATAFNISSDLMLLGIPIPIVVRSHLPLKRKLVLCCVLGLGAINILMAVLNRYHNFTNPNELVYTYWYVAEVATAVYVGNLPLCWQFISHVFKTGSWASYQARDGPQPNSNNGAGMPNGNRPAKRRAPYSILPRSLFTTNNLTRLSTPRDDDVWGPVADSSSTQVNTTASSNSKELHVCINDFSKEDIELSRTTISTTAAPEDMITPSEETRNREPRVIFLRPTNIIQ